MSAVVTDKFRFTNAENFKADTVAAGNSYYLFIGRSQQWADDLNAPQPSSNTYDQRNAWENLQALKILTDGDTSHCVPRYDWVPSTYAFAEFNDRDDELYTKRFYCMTDEFNVYICLKSGAGVSVTKPTGQSTESFQTVPNDGYTWKYLFTVTAADSVKFMTNSYIPVKRFTEDELLNGLPDGSPYEPQRQISLAAVDGAINHMVISDGGTNYAQATTTVVIEGNGVGATAEVFETGGVITDITITDIGSGYTYARAVITDSANGVGATAYPIIAPPGGHGFDPAKELGGYLITANIKLEQADGDGDFTVGNDYRQLGILKNPFDFGTTTVSSEITLNALKEFTFALGSDSGIQNDELIVGQSSGAVAMVDKYIATNGPDAGTLRYHQDETTGYTPFVLETILGSTSSGAATIATLTNPEVETFSGDIIFLENRSPINRAADQTESIKLVIEF